MISNFKNVLVLAPHTDDGELGAGGTIAKLVEAGSQVTYIAFSTASDSVPQGLPPDILKTEVKAATEALGILDKNLIVYDYQVRHLNYHRQDILEDLIKLRENNQFDLVLTPSLKDIHQDHVTIAKETVRAFKNITILGYELIWNNLSFDTNVLLSSRSDIYRKNTPLLGVISLKITANIFLGILRFQLQQLGAFKLTKYAECFEVIRLFL